MTKKTEITLLYRIAQRYYIDKIPQSQIAEMENISRSQISRLLDRAEQLGIVTITVQMPERPDLKALAEALRTSLKLSEVIIAPIEALEANEEQRRGAIVTAAAQYLSRAFRSAKTVGIGWGRTMYETTRILSYRRAPGDVMFVPLVGMSGTDDPYLQINTIVDRLAEKHHARSYFVGSPVYRSRELAMSGIDEQRIKLLEAYWDELDVAVFGLGTPPCAGHVFLSEFDEDYKHMLSTSGAVGDILSQYFRPDGSVLPIDPVYRSLAFDIKRLHRIRQTICLAGGSDKRNGIIAAARSGYMKTLVTDSVTAKEIYDNLRREGEIH